MNTYRGETFAYGEERGVSVLDEGGTWRQHVEDVFGGSSRGEVLLVREVLRAESSSASSRRAELAWFFWGKRCVWEG
ncbi:Uncharacterised protein [Bartonella quintana]|nr:Uncharacterised protein [Bartonella quintana]